MRRWQSPAKKSRTANRTSSLQAIGPASGLTASKSSAPPPHAQARRGPLLQHLAWEAKQRGGPATGLCRHPAGWFDQRAGLHQPAEILLVQMPPRDRFHGPLQFGEREFGRQKLKYHGTVFQFGAQPRDCRGQNSPVVEPHRYAEVRNRFARQCRGASVPSRLLDQSGLVEQFVTVQHALLVPLGALGAEIKPHPILAAERARGVRLLALGGPAREFGKDIALDNFRPRCPPVFP